MTSANWDAVISRLSGWVIHRESSDRRIYKRHAHRARSGGIACLGCVIGDHLSHLEIQRYHRRSSAILSLLRIVRHSYHPHTAVLVEDEKGEWRLHPPIPGSVTAPGLILYRFGAPLFYANANRFAEEIRSLVKQAPTPVRWLIVDAGPITRIDYTAARSLRRLKEVLDRQSVYLAFAHVDSDLKIDLDRHHLTEVIGLTRLFDSMHQAIAAIHR